MTGDFKIIFIPLLPLLSFLLLGLFGRKYLRNSSGLIGTLSLLGSALLSLFTACNYFFVTGKVNGVYQQLVVLQHTWLEFSPGISIDMGLLIDPISVMMIVIVTFISLMVHIYSLGYMKGEERFATYYAFLSLFTFSMLGLVLSTNIFQIYIFWELVGVSSYLLIGFYFERPTAVAAAKKAFIVTRFADLGFLIGILVLAFGAETLEFKTLILRLTTATPQLQGMVATTFLGFSSLTWALLLVFAGGAGKSAMFPLHIWLPDAMEGPTPVSALIHAATMVVAGVYLVARLFPVFAISAPGALHVVGYGGENGLGYMASMFHLFTHAMFKALLFLGAGAVIHYVHSNDMEDMGGLRTKMPITHLTFLVACLAISGIPPFAGFFSKEEILTAAFQHNKLIYGIALFTSGLTAFYMFRLYFSIFWKKDFHAEHHNNHGEGTWTMKLPLIILGVLAALAGFVPFSHFVTSDGKELDTVINLSFSVAPVLFAITGILIAFRLYKSQNEVPDKIALAFGSFYRGALHKFYIDELYLFITKKVIFNLVGRPSAWIDRNIVDGGVNLSADLTEDTSSLIRNWQSGNLQQYAVWFFAAVIGLVMVFMSVWR